MRPHQLSRLARAVLLPLTSAAFVLGAHAQGSANETGQPAAKPDARSPASAPSNAYRAVRASEVIGMKVKNEKGENLGEIGDFIVNMNSGDLRYAILRFDPGIFTSERLFAVQTKELQLGPDRKHVVYRMSKERLEKTAIDRSDWNRGFFDDPDRLARLDRAIGIVQPSAGERAHRMSDLIGHDVKTRAGEGIGEIEDVVINMANQKVHYAVLHFDVGWTTPDKRVVFPLRAFNVAQGNNELVLDIDKSRLRAMKDFTRDNYANLNDQVWLVDVDRYLVTVAPAADASKGASASMGASGSGPAHSSEAMQKLQQSAQRLRESIQTMAQRPPGAKRDFAIGQAHEALRETNASMVALLPSLQGAGNVASGKAPSGAEYDKSVQQLMKAVDSLRESIQAMAKQPAGDARTRAMEQANKALWETQEAMISAYRQPGGSSAQTMGASGRPGDGPSKPQASM